MINQGGGDLDLGLLSRVVCMCSVKVIRHAEYILDPS